MKLSDFDYNLPKNLIAQEPVRPRDHSRLLVLNKSFGKTEHRHFYDLVNYLKAGDVLVLNNSKVFPARLIGQRKETGGKVEIFLLKKIRESLPDPCEGSRRLKGEVWECLAGGRRKKKGLEIVFAKGLECELIKNNNDGTWQVKFNKKGRELMRVVEKIGRVPLPPYIKRSERRPTSSKTSDVFNDKNDYQTIYADNDKIGSVAAPTAGFHFTPGLIKKLKKKGVQFEYVTLHVGLGTFAPVKVDNIKKHKMHAEYVEIKKEAAKRILKAKQENKKIIAVGTTSVRTLEAVFKKKRGSTSNLEVEPREGFSDWVNIFIYPGFKFKLVDAMITNFHLPKSTLLMLISAFAGKKNIDKVYKEAIKKKYRFYSYGDAMLIF